ncbi:MAG: alpha-L-fucosidase [Planctomycetota bacterium]|jgi:alpha-L-fucosidase
MARKVKTAEQRDRKRRMKWWHKAKYGMFIHWGSYSVLGRHEWAKEVEAVPVAEYEKLARRFKPKRGCVRKMAKLAKAAGMRYMVLTTKHHEGFCLWDTQTTDYCAPKQACGRDLIAEYVKAARAERLRVGFYFSLMDWHHPDGAKCATDEAARKRFVKYVHAQVRELVSNYGRLDILWYDGSWPLSAAGWQSRKLNNMVRRLQPGIIINNRSGLPEDFSTPEQHIRGAEEGRAWETCMTLNGSWGYHRNDDLWKPPKQVIMNLAQCAAGGGNYLLNIGPRGDGSIPQPSVRILTDVGKWLKRNREAIFTNDRCEVGHSLFARFTRRGKALYVLAHHWPGSRWAVAGLRTKVKSARLLATGEPVKFKQDGMRVVFSGLPAGAPDSPVTVLKLNCAGTLRQRPRNEIRLKLKRGKVDMLD